MKDYKNQKIFEPLDDEESELMDELERGEWKSLPPDLFISQKKDLELAAKNTLKKTERATIRLTKPDIDGLKILAAKEGIGYQTLISSILHKVVTGQMMIKH